MPKGVYARKVQTLAERFWPKVDRRGPDECWPWLAFRKANGYGSINEAGHDGHPLQAHRVAWELTHGPIAEGLFVCHRCDNPPCCNPAHLFLGTHEDNVGDMVKKDRVSHGEKHHHRKLTEEQVRWLREHAVPGVSKERIARDLGITSRHARKIASRGAWRRTA